MTDLFDDWYVHTVDVDTLTGHTPDGADVLEDHQDVECLVEDGVRVVTTGSGEQLLSQARLHGPLSIAPLFTPGSHVHWRGRTMRVASTAVFDADPDLASVTVVLT